MGAILARATTSLCLPVTLSVTKRTGRVISILRGHPSLAAHDRTWLASQLVLRGSSLKTSRYLMPPIDGENVSCDVVVVVA